RELHNDGKFKILILTHNFDFYRTVAKRLYLGRKAILMTLRKDDRSIILAQGGYLNDIFNHFKDNLSDTKVFVSIIPLVRNLIEYIEGHSSQSYLLLTSCLHIKAETRTITCDQILKLVQKIFPTTGSKSISFGSKLIRDHVYDTA